jgi:uncharacterized protein (DUF2249 family)
MSFADLPKQHRQTFYYQFKFEHEGQFAWDYQEQRPQVSRERVGKVK